MARRRLKNLLKRQQKEWKNEIKTKRIIWPFATYNTVFAYCEVKKCFNEGIFYKNKKDEKMKFCLDCGRLKKIHKDCDKVLGANVFYESKGIIKKK